MTQTIAEALIEEGRIAGRAEAELQTTRDTLRRLLLRKFQQLPESLLQRIEACTDVERLKGALDCILDVQSLDQLDL